MNCAKNFAKMYLSLLGGELMKKLTFAICGMGNRGTKYASKQFEFPDDMEVVAIADPRPVALETANKYLKLPETALFSSAEEMLSQPRLADVMIISTQDAMHKMHALKALEQGYDLILEKPIANHLSDCQEIADKARELGRKALVCHVLRYTPFYREVKNQIVNGAVGKVESVEAMEGVGYYHIAHSYVRGNWHRKEDSSPMIVAKCCHDMDLILWLTGEKALKLNSFGSLDHFRAENCPEGATERCTDGCPVKDCPFNAEKFYLSRLPGWPTHVLHPEPTVENIMEALRTTDYGRCVYKMNNDVVDHQTVNIQLTNNVTASFQMVGFTKMQDRHIRIMGTEGELWGDFRSKQIHVARFTGEEEIIDVSNRASSFEGHGGGDSGLIKDAIHYFRGDDFDRTSITELVASVDSHRLAFAAERSRLDGGQLVDLTKEFSQENL